MAIALKTNNVAEIWALEEGLSIFIRKKIQKLVIEGDSKTIINVLHKIQCESEPSNVSNSWGLAVRIGNTTKLLEKS